MDPFVGVGGNLIQFARICGYCLGVDLEKTKVEYTEFNAGQVYKLGDNFRVEQSDFLLFENHKSQESKSKVDAVFMSPPWGGPGY